MNRSPYSYRRRQAAWLLALSLAVSAVRAQLPDTDIWLFNIEKKENRYQALAPQNITNRPGYDSQPAFTPDGKSILYVSIREDGQADIYRYDIRSKLHTNITKSKVSEYSPTILPDESGFSTVVVEQDSAQRVWILGFDGAFVRFASDATDSVGYHSWLGMDTMLYYKLTEPHSLHALNLKSGKDVWICDRPARAFRRIPGSPAFIYAIKQEKTMEFRVYKASTKESRVYATYPSLTEDFIWHQEFGLVKAEGSDLLRYDEKGARWEPLLSLAAAGIRQITRFTFDPRNKKLVVVSHL